MVVVDITRQKAFRTIEYGYSSLPVELAASKMGLSTEETIKCRLFL
jgi:hypothetical protein